MNFKVKFCVNIFASLVVLMTVFFIVMNYKNSVMNIGEKSKIVNEKYIESILNFESANVTQTNVNKMKNILIWTKNTTVPFMFLLSGTEAVVLEKCEYQNCYVTNDMNYLPSLADFDALLFHVPEYTWRGKVYHFGEPGKRSPHQKYILTCIESSHNYPICDSKYDNFFNWTWTYKLDSDVMWSYMVVKDAETHQIVGPKRNMTWKEFRNEVSEEKKKELKTKSKAVAWFVSNCHTKSGREKYADELSRNLNKYGLRLDKYGSCGNMKCERDSKECYNKLKNDYFFYLAFENSFSDDYVTEKFVNAMKYGVVPIVWGGANYDDFAPPGSYINAREISSDDLAVKIDYYMKNMNDYAEFFKWTSHYYYQRDIEDAQSRSICNLCRALNDPEKVAKHKTYTNIKSWWNGDHKYC